MSSLVSIIVPVYNVEKYLKRCIESIINQDYKNIEVIIVNDGSTDDSNKILQDFERVDNRICVINKENGGLSSARNVGLRRAKGDFICFVDSDDWIDHLMITKMIKICIQENADIVQCGYREVYENRTIGKVVKLDEKDFTGKSITSIYFSNIDFHTVVWNKIYKRSILNEISFVEGKQYEDTMASFEMLLKSKRLYNISDVFYNYYQRDNSIMGSVFSERKLDALFAGRYVINLCEEQAIEYIDQARILFCYYCFCLYAELSMTNIKSKSKFKKQILQEYSSEYHKIDKIVLNDAKSNAAKLVKLFNFNKALITFIYNKRRKYNKKVLS
ncbi:glycosyltransferase [Priestia megaterium]|uniref:glycosyltransferase family 2 protein n=1 Tax=Priestia megaterium TaxID=1404 RepID=UPI0020416B95|nr:glycosyltransferase [Priestia megaterium]MCM3150853.1 glycosyltransferase [Priestia megaterium]